MQQKSYDDRINAILQSPISKKQKQPKLDRLNEAFEKFYSDRDKFFDDEDETEVEDEEHEIQERLKLKRLLSPYSETNFTRLPLHSMLKIASFVMGFAFAFFLIWKSKILRSVYFFSQTASTNVTPANNRENTAFMNSTPTDHLFDSLQPLISRLEKLEGQLSTDNEKFQTLVNKIASLQNEDNIASRDQNELQTFQDLLFNKSSNKHKMSEVFKMFEEQLTGSVIRQLPYHVPVIINDQKIQYSSEFANFIRNLTTQYDQNKNEDYLSNTRNCSEAVSSWNCLKNQMDEQISSQFAQTYDLLLYEVRSLFKDFEERHTLPSEIPLSVNRSEGVIQSNFADYRSGARILGYLTTTSPSWKTTRPFYRKLLFGLYDYFNSHGIKNPNTLQLNANNVLSDNDLSWQCEAVMCTIGVRLSYPVFLTHLLLRFPPDKKAQTNTNLSVFVKPKRKQYIKQLLEVSENEDMLIEHNDHSNNPYLTKFVKVHSSQLNLSKPLHIISLPRNFVNLNIPVKDIYLEFSSTDDEIEVCCVKVCGQNSKNGVSKEPEVEAPRLDFSGQSTSQHILLGNDQIT
ncbi:hypothetical protein FDK38_003593 [Candidozyma auris]|nr:hypothetical protein FDK38_003593 [[Candida] auris]